MNKYKVRTKDGNTITVYATEYYHHEDGYVYFRYVSEDKTEIRLVASIHSCGVKYITELFPEYENQEE